MLDGAGCTVGEPHAAEGCLHQLTTNGIAPFLTVQQKWPVAGKALLSDTRGQHSLHPFLRESGLRGTLLLFPLPENLVKDVRILRGADYLRC